MPDRPAFVPGARSPDHPATRVWLLFRNGDLLVAVEGGRAALPTGAPEQGPPVPAGPAHFIGMWGETACWTAELAAESAPPPGLELLSLRRLFAMLDETAFWIAARAVQIVEWDRTHRFCGRCAAPLHTQPDEHAKRCPSCGLTQYPRLAPAVIVAVTRGERLLLAHNRRHPARFYSVLAGFVEAGETLEEAVQREVREETGIAVQNIRYFGSQPWPFPHSLMVAFTAEYAGGEIALDGEELETADWFTADALPPYPPPPSIAHALIRRFIDTSVRSASNSSGLY